jgi:outer membrane protein OmpU
MNMKKIGMTALAASLVSVSANAAELTATGGASINANHYSAGKNLNYGKSFTMGNSVVLSGSGETENGINVSVSFEMDQGTANNSDKGFDNHSVTVGNDMLGTLVFSGHGGNSTTTAINTTAAGDIWDTFNGALTAANAATGVAIKEASAGNNSFFYTAPSLMDGVAITLSYNPHNDTETDSKGAIGYGISYSGIDGLSVSYAAASIATHATGTDGDNTAFSAKYAYGPVTVAYSMNEHDVGTVANDQDLTSYSVSYTVSENLSVSYGTEEISSGTANDQDAEYTKVSASYTTGGVTISASFQEAENIAHGTGTEEDQDYYGLGASFAF